MGTSYGHHSPSSTPFRPRTVQGRPLLSGATKPGGVSSPPCCLGGRTVESSQPETPVGRSEATKAGTFRELSMVLTGLSVPWAVCLLQPSCSLSLSTSASLHICLPYTILLCPVHLHSPSLPFSFHLVEPFLTKYTPQKLWH